MIFSTVRKVDLLKTTIPAAPDEEELSKPLDDRLTAPEKEANGVGMKSDPDAIGAEKHGTDDLSVIAGNESLALKCLGSLMMHPKGERNIEERLEGFPGSPGIVEGPAKVIMDYKDFQKVKAGEILVCPYTGTAWTPLFVKIGGVTRTRAVC